MGVKQEIFKNLVNFLYKTQSVPVDGFYPWPRVMIFFILVAGSRDIITMQCVFPHMYGIKKKIIENITFFTYLAPPMRP